MSGCGATGNGNGKTIDAIAIHAALAAAPGGGAAVVPAGTFVCLPIRRKSQVDLYLSGGYAIRAAKS